MRVHIKALASLLALPFLSASCVTPPPMPSSPDARTASYTGPAAVPANYRASQDRYGDRYDGPPGRQGDYGYSDEFDPRYNERGQYAPPPEARLQVLLGGRSLDDEGFEPTDSPGVIGFEFSQVPSPGGLGFEFGVNFGFDEENDVSVPGIGVADLELTQAEIYAGARAEFGQGAVRPYIGGGGTLISTTTRVQQGFLEREEDDTTLGAYLHGGIQADLNDNFFLGIDYRRVFGGEYEVGGEDF
ncbi:MAG: outer membrane beta-barrel protein, partial [Planctomycetota bacterium]